MPLQHSTACDKLHNRSLANPVLSRQEGSRSWSGYGTDLGALGFCGPPSASASNNVDHFAHLLLHSPSFQFPSIEPSNKLMQQNEEAAQEVQSSTCAAAQEEETEDESDSESEDVAGHTVRHEDDTAAALASFSTSEHVMFWQMLGESASAQDRQWMRSVLAQFLVDGDKESALVNIIVTAAQPA